MVHDGVMNTIITAIDVMMLLIMMMIVMVMMIKNG